MIYVGFGAFGSSGFSFEDVVAIFTVLFGFMHLILSCTGSVRDEGGSQTQTVTKTTTVKRTSGMKKGSSARGGGRV